MGSLWLFDVIYMMLTTTEKDWEHEQGEKSWKEKQQDLRYQNRGLGELFTPYSDYEE